MTRIRLHRSIQGAGPFFITTLGEIGLVICPVLLGFDSVDERRWIFSGVGMVFWCSIALTATGKIFTWKNSAHMKLLEKRISESEQEILELERQAAEFENQLNQSARGYSDTLDLSLAILAAHLGFTETERISVYIHNGSGLILLGRYSQNSKYREKGRIIYPHDQGCIGRAWMTGEFFCELTDPKADFEAYCAEQARLGIDRRTVWRLAMKSCSYFAWAIQDSRFGKRIAIIVFESVRPGALRRDELKSKLNDGEEDRIYQLLKKLSEHRKFLPNAMEASQQGY